MEVLNWMAEHWLLTVVLVWIHQRRDASSPGRGDLGSEVAMRASIILCAVLWAIVIGGNVWATMYGSPQHVWFFCDMLGWCAPTHLPFGCEPKDTTASGECE